MNKLLWMGRMDQRPTTSALGAKPVKSFVVMIRFLCASLVLQGTLSGAEFRTYNSSWEFMQACRTLPGYRQSLGIQNFSCLTPEGYYPEGAPLKISGVTFLGSGPYATQDGFLWSFDAPEIIIRFPQGARAFGANFSSLTREHRSSFTATITVDGVETYAFPALTHPAHVFFGVISTDSSYSFTNIFYDDGGGIDRTNFNGQALLGNPLMVLNQIPNPVLRLEKAFSIVVTNVFLLTWSASNPGFAVQQNSNPMSPNWVTVSGPSHGCTDSWFQFIVPSEHLFYRLVYIPAF